MRDVWRILHSVDAIRHEWGAGARNIALAISTLVTGYAAASIRRQRMRFPTGVSWLGKVHHESPWALPAYCRSLKRRADPILSSGSVVCPRISLGLAVDKFRTAHYSGQQHTNVTEQASFDRPSILKKSQISIWAR
jgi:hypothetical protein